MLAIAQKLPQTDNYNVKISVKTNAPSSIKIGVAYNGAFCFYYPDNLEALEAAGAELVFFEPFNDARIPDVDAVYLGGGFPESFLHELEKTSQSGMIYETK